MYFIGQVQGLVRGFHIEIAHPASAEAHRGCGKANMLGGYGAINVGVVLAIVLAGPRRIGVDTHRNYGWSLSEPCIVVAFAQLGPRLSARCHDEFPGLAVHCRGCEARTFEHIIQFLALNLAGLICPDGISESVV